MANQRLYFTCAFNLFDSYDEGKLLKRVNRKAMPATVTHWKRGWGKVCLTLAQARPQCW